MTTQTPTTAEIENWLRVRFSQIFDSGSGSGSERKMQNPAGFDSGTSDLVPPLVDIYHKSLTLGGSTDHFTTIDGFRSVVYRIRILESNPAGY